MNKFYKTAKDLITILKQHHWLIIIIIFIFILARNHKQLFLVDLNDGVLAKIYLGQNGYNLDSIAGYLKNFALSNYNQHFIPAWFSVYFILCLFDLNPIIVGIFACLIAAIFCYMLFEVVILYTKNRNYYLATFITITFMSTLMFTEILAWKWMLSLLISSTCFLLCLRLINDLKKQNIVIFLLSLSTMVWCFSPSIILGWSLILYNFLHAKKEGKKAISLPITSASIILLIATFVLAITGDQHTTLNPLFILINTPSMLIITILSCIMSLLGIYKFTEIWIPFINLSVVTGIVFMFVFLFEVIIKRNKLLPIKNYALIASMSLSYLAIVALVLFRLMPNSGISYAQDPTNYIVGNRYVFVFSIPLVLILVYPLDKLFNKLSRFTKLLMIVSMLILGCLISILYSKIDPIISNTNRYYFYTKTPSILKEVESKHLVLPNISSSVLYSGRNIELKDAIYYRNDSRNFSIDFVNPENMSLHECLSLKSNREVSSWLTSYSKEWCNI